MLCSSGFPDIKRSWLNGFAVPGALAARLAYPEKPVIAFTGDGGLLMAVADIQTSVREKLPIILVFDDGEIGLNTNQTKYQRYQPLWSTSRWY